MIINLILNSLNSLKKTVNLYETIIRTHIRYFIWNKQLKRVEKWETEIITNFYNILRNYTDTNNQNSIWVRYSYTF